MSAADIATGNPRDGTDWIRPLRLACGLFLLVFIFTHFINHALGLVSLDALESGRVVFLALWRNTPAETALLAALLAHYLLALYLIYQRKTLRMPLCEAVQIILGLAIPPLLYFILSLANPVNVGIRHLLPVYPFLFVLLAATAFHFHRSARAALIAAQRYTQDRVVFGQPLTNYSLTQVKLARMAARYVCCRLLTFQTARTLEHVPAPLAVLHHVELEPPPALTRRPVMTPLTKSG